jgi:hypothetical protein
MSTQADFTPVISSKDAVTRTLPGAPPCAPKLSLAVVVMPDAPPATFVAAAEPLRAMYPPPPPPPGP